MPSGKWDPAKLIEVLFKELESRERFKYKTSSETSPKIIVSQRLNSGCIIYVVSENINQNPPKITCSYFTQYHSYNRCRVVTDVSV